MTLQFAQAILLHPCIFWVITVHPGHSWNCWYILRTLEHILWLKKIEVRRTLVSTFYTALQCLPASSSAPKSISSCNSSKKNDNVRETKFDSAYEPVKYLMKAKAARLKTLLLLRRNTGPNKPRIFFLELPKFCIERFLFLPPSVSRCKQLYLRRSQFHFDIRERPLFFSQSS